MRVEVRKEMRAEKEKGKANEKRQDKRGENENEKNMEIRLRTRNDGPAGYQLLEIDCKGCRSNEKLLDRSIRFTQRCLEYNKRVRD